MIKVGLVGFGFMGKCHLHNYMRLESEGMPVKVVAICDVDINKFKGSSNISGNINVGEKEYDLTRFNLYNDIDEMLKKEELDIVDITLPTYLHEEVSIKALNNGIHVICEKPMALTSDECQRMIEASEKNNKKLMIAHCLRFWPAYEYLKQCVVENRFGKVVSAYFFRGGGTPKWSYQNWLLNKEKSGACLFDQHVHDVDMINWLFGKPLYVSTIGISILPGKGYDAVSTNYIFDEPKVVNAQDDWTLNGDFGFEMTYRVNFENGNIVFEKGKVRVNPANEKGFSPELPAEDGYYRELKYFVNVVLNDIPLDIISPYSAMDTIKILEAEKISADNNGMLVRVE